jgi:hypothetical protein
MTPASSIEPAGAVLAIWTDIAPELEADFDEWYWREHLPQRLSVPGFRRGRRFRAIDGARRSFACYDLASVETIVSPAYLERLDSPTAWTKRVMPGFRNTTRAIFRSAGGLGQACGATAPRLRLSPRPEQRAGFTEYLHRTCFPALHARPGIVRTRLWLAEPVTAPSTREAALRGGADAASDWVVIVEGTTREDLLPVRDEFAAATSPFLRSAASAPIIALYDLLRSFGAGR